MKKSICTVLMVMMIMVVSCGDRILDVSPKLEQLTNDALATPKGLAGAIIPVYDFPRMQFRHTESKECLYFIAGTHLITASGLLSPDKGMALYDNTLNSTHTASYMYWRDSYKALNQANAIIGRADKVGFTDPDTLNRLVSEARFFRAYILFYLHQRFTKIPLITEEVIDPVNTYQPADSAALYKVITDDLTFAVANLDLTYSEKGRITKGAAEHLLAKVYMVMGKWTDAAATATEVINSGQYSLLTDRTALWADNSQDNAEAIWVIQYANSALDGEPPFMAPMFQPLIDRIPGVKRTFDMGGRPWARFYPSKYLLDLFDSTDKRLDADYKTVWLYNDDENLPMKILPQLPEGTTDSITINVGDTIKWEHVNNILYWGPACKKYWEYGTSRTLADAWCRKGIIRYRLAETYLIAGEALWRDGKTAEALTMINKVRERAGATAFTDLDEKTILDEYARELAFENEDWFLLKRTGKLVEYVQQYSPDEEAQNNIKETNVRMPIPQSFLDATPGYPQNPGYN